MLRAFLFRFQRPDSWSTSQCSDFRSDLLQLCDFLLSCSFSYRQQFVLVLINVVADSPQSLASTVWCPCLQSSVKFIACHGFVCKCLRRVFVKLHKVSNICRVLKYLIWISSVSLWNKLKYGHSNMQRNKF